MRSARDLVKELYYWIHIGTGDDIVNCPDQRKEYQALVSTYKNVVSNSDIPEIVLNELIHEMRRPVIFQPTFWRLLWQALFS